MMDKIPPRYVLLTSNTEFKGGKFKVIDMKESVEVCVCGERRHAMQIIDALEMEVAREYIRSIP
jgi:hypothetical protein